MPNIEPNPRMLLLEDIKKSYREPGGGELPILEIDRLEVGPGEQVVLWGRSGCGKTTLLHAIAGLTSIDAGRIVLDGVEVQKLSESVRDQLRADKIGYVFQTFNLLAGFSALENVLLGMTFTRGRADGQWARSLLEQVGLGHRLHHKPAALSVGEQQRVAVARALASRPVLLLADEPTANVDPSHQQQIVDLLREACREHQISLFMVTHAPEVAEQFDRVVKLEEVNRVARLGSSQVVAAPGEGTS